MRVFKLNAVSCVLAGTLALTGSTAALADETTDPATSVDVSNNAILRSF